MSSIVHPGWHKLLVWLSDQHGMDSNIPVQARSHPNAGYGLYATKSIPPSTPLFKIPGTALLNSTTIQHLYPKTQPRLTATQLISLHLLLHRPPSDTTESGDSKFGPYISILPRHFDDHPLTWHWKTSTGAIADQHSIAERRLLDALPPRVLYDLEKVADRFQKDWKRINSFLEEEDQVLVKSRFKTGKTKMDKVEMEKDFLWAWLNVNTRCVFYHLERDKTHPDNLTLCPILDFANHSNIPPFTLPGSQNASTTNRKRKFTLLSPAIVTTESNSELFLEYGSHPNRTLFVEYGFVNAFTAINNRGELDVHLAVIDLFSKSGVASRMEETLTEEGYWGDWTIHSSPTPAHPSFRLITTLRLFHLLTPADESDVVEHPNDIQLWRETLLGKRECISAENEYQWRTTLLDLCLEFIDETQKGLLQFRNPPSRKKTWIEGCIEMLWVEELYVAQAVAESVRCGVQF